MTTLLFQEERVDQYKPFTQTRARQAPFWKLDLLVWVGCGRSSGRSKWILGSDSDNHGRRLGREGTADLVAPQLRIDGRNKKNLDIMYMCTSGLSLLFANFEVLEVFCCGVNGGYTLLFLPCYPLADLKLTCSRDRLFMNYHLLQPGNLFT